MNNLISLYILNRKQNSTVVLLSALALLLLLIRVKITHSFYLLFLIWNLILAIIPYAVSSQIKNDFSITKSNLKNLIYMMIWLLFIPNTFYLITDFVHLYHKSLLQFAFDSLLLTNFTVAGFYLGILSISDIHKLIKSKYPKSISNGFKVTISYLCAFGVYLGRILRFNSWDIISNPVHLFESMLMALFQKEAFFFTLQLGSLILISYGLVSKYNSAKNK